MTARNPIPLKEISLLILAGGKGSRMGGLDKGLMDIAGKPAIEHLLERFYTHPGPLMISANRNLERYAGYGYPVLEDTSNGFPGPLAGILSGLQAAPGRYLLTMPVDAPLVQHDYPVRMAAAFTDCDCRACVASLNQRIEPVFCLLDTLLAPALQDYLARGLRPVNGWLAEIGAVPVDFSDAPQQFLNLNIEQDKEKLRAHLASPTP